MRKIFIYLLLLLVLVPNIASAAINWAAVDTIKTTSAVVRWDSYTPYGYRIQYGTTTSYGGITTYIDQAYFGFNEITGLSASTTYHYRFELTDMTGAISYSSDYTFTTRDQTTVDNLIKTARGDSYTGRVYYVDQSSGNNGNTGLSTSLAWKTLAYASKQLKAGDTLYLMDNTWTNDQFLPSNSGIDIAPITVKNYPGASPKLITTNGADTIQMNYKSYYIFDGLDIQSNGGSNLHGHHNTVRNSWFHGEWSIEMTDDKFENSWNILEYSRAQNSKWNVVQLSNDIARNTRAVKYVTIRGVEVYGANAHSSIDLAGNFAFVTVDNVWLHDSTNPDYYPHDAGSGNSAKYITVKNAKIDGSLAGANYEGLALHDSIIVGAVLLNNIMCNFDKEYAIRTAAAEGQAAESGVFIYNTAGYHNGGGLINPKSKFTGSNNIEHGSTTCPTLSVTPEKKDSIAIPTPAPTPIVIPTPAPTPIAITTPAPTPTPSPVPTLTNNLVSKWSFDEGAGIVATDSNGNINDLDIINGPVWVNGKIGKALRFDGVNDYASDMSAIGIPSSEPFSVELWINPTSLSNPKWSDFFRKAGSWALQADPNGNMSFEITGKKDRVSNVVIPMNVWTHIALTFEGTAVKFYKDGILVETIVTTNVPDAGSNTIYIGGLSSWGTYFNGIIDEVKIYNRSLSEVEINADYQNSVLPTPAPITTVNVNRHWG
jgi:hypothetical protein